VYFNYPMLTSPSPDVPFSFRRNSCVDSLGVCPRLSFFFKAPPVIIRLDFLSFPASSSGVFFCFSSSCEPPHHWRCLASPVYVTSFHLSPIFSVCRVGRPMVLDPYQVVVFEKGPIHTPPSAVFPYSVLRSDTLPPKLRCSRKFLVFFFMNDLIPPMIPRPSAKRICSSFFLSFFYPLLPANPSV